MSRVSAAQINEELDMEYFLDRESIAFRETRGVSGAQLNIKTCPNPNCQDERWRVYFGIDTGKGNCFVCSETFDKMGYLHRYFGHGDTEWGQTYREAEEIMKEQGWRPKRQAMVAVDHGEVVLPMSLPLPLETGENLAYLEQRGFDSEIARYFGLRWCEFGWWTYKDAEGKRQTQNFSNRVIIPVFDLDGTLKTFQGRDLAPAVSAAEKEAGAFAPQKYLFPKELPGTGRYLLNGHNAVATDHVVMGEGAFDVAAIKVAFDEDPALRNIVPIGSFGKHLSYGSPDGDDQLGRFTQLRARGIKFVTIMWDGEEKALTAALNAAKLLTGRGLTARIALLPHDKDPNEVVGEVVRRAFYSATPYSASIEIKWRLRNPYAVTRKSNAGLVAV